MPPHPPSSEHSPANVVLDVLDVGSVTHAHIPDWHSQSPGPSQSSNVSHSGASVVVVVTVVVVIVVVVTTAPASLESSQAPQSAAARVTSATQTSFTAPAKP